MVKKSILLALCMFSSVFAASPVPDDSQVGRYQVAGRDGSSSIYLLDTATGQVWKSGCRTSGIQHDHWYLIIPESPVYPQ